MGLPGINTIFNHTDPTKEAYNRARPRTMSRTTPMTSPGWSTLITYPGRHRCDPATHAAIAAALLPDVITYNTATSANFANLNGRALDQ